MILKPGLSILLLSLPVAANAAPAASPPVQRLSDAQVEKVLADAAARREATEVATVVPKRQIEGEVGVEVGTGGHRAAFGTAVVPLGENGTAVVSFDTSTSRQYYGRRRR